MLHNCNKCEICDKKTDYTIIANGRCNYCFKSDLHSHHICKKCGNESETAKNKDNPKKRDVRSQK